MRDAYFEAAIADEVRKVVEARPGARNNVLNSAAYNLATLGISEQTIRSELTRATERNGLFKSDGPKAVQATIASGTKAGYANPRQTHHWANSTASFNHRPQSSPSAKSSAPHSPNGSAPATAKPPPPSQSPRKIQIPSRTPPDKDGKPKFIIADDEGPKRTADELRRHVSHRDGVAVRVKVKYRDRESKPAFANWYRVHDNGTLGWQNAKPDRYIDVPYLTSGTNPFDPEVQGDELYWPEGEKDVDSITKAGGLAFTFGGTGDGLTDDIKGLVVGCVSGRNVVIPADNDQGGREHAQKKAALAHQTGAKSVRIVEFPELRENGDVSDWFAHGHTLEELQARADATPLWSPPSSGSTDSAAAGARKAATRKTTKPSKSTETLSPPPQAEPRWPDLNKSGKPSATCANARLAIEALGIDCKYDTFHDRKLVGGHAIEQYAGEFSDHACQVLRVVIKEHFGFDPGKENTNDATVQLCLWHQFDPVREYLDGLEWDGTRRLDKWMTTYLGAEDTELTRAIGRLVLVAAVRRARQPGCKFDQITVLEGPEGTGKSTAIEILAGKENFSDQTILGLDDRQQQENTRGVWLYEIADLAGMSKADVDKVKAFASRLSDRARPAYGRQRVEQPRRCTFFATTNDETYLQSQTGNRRFWPVKTGEIELAALRRDRDQLWAEAAEIEATGVPLKLPETLWLSAATEQDKRREPDPWDEMLANVKGTVCDAPDGSGKEERISTTTLFKLDLNLSADKCTNAAMKRLSYCMRRLGWEKPASAIRIPDEGQVRGFRRSLKH
jgi:hypothetical protein